MVAVHKARTLRVGDTDFHVALDADSRVMISFTCGTRKINVRYCEREPWYALGVPYAVVVAAKEMSTCR